jgi:hypothetical protein
MRSDDRQVRPGSTKPEYTTGLEAVQRIRSGSADFIGASGYAAHKAGYRTATFLA